MAEQVQRYRQYEYRANSNLVLTTDQHRPRTDEPSGEPESLKDFMDGTKFGDRVHYGKPDIAGAGQKRKADKNAASVKKGRKEQNNVLGLADDIDSYRPRSKETRSAYEVRAATAAAATAPGGRGEAKTFRGVWRASRQSREPRGCLRRICSR